MKTTHTFEKSFGPAASFTGIVIFIVGLLALYYSVFALVLVLIGAFMGFTNTSTTIDAHNKRIRFTNNIFGILKIGNWIPVQKDMKIGIKQEKNIYRTYSRSNQIIDIKMLQKKIYLYDENSKPLFPIMQLKEEEEKNDLNDTVNILCKELGLTRIN